MDKYDIQRMQPPINALDAKMQNEMVIELMTKDLAVTRRNNYKAHTYQENRPTPNCGSTI